jgi:uncharacterized protein (DUF305 family)
MNLKWTLPILLVTSIAAAQMPSIMDRFMLAMRTSMTAMDKGMTEAAMTGDIDRDFAAMMTPHHRGAIDMARAELSYGKDPVMRRLAEEIIVDQQSEIDAMALWLSRKH